MIVRVTYGFSYNMASEEEITIKSTLKKCIVEESAGSVDHT